MKAIIALERYQGCILGLALGDALGASGEGGVMERLLWKIIGKTRDGLPRWTDDTQMAIDIVQILLAYRTIEQDALANKFAQSYKWIRGYGPGAAKILKAIRSGSDWRAARTIQYLEGSLGNGAAMRTAPIALFFSDDFERMLVETRKAAEITHAHPVGIEGAVAVSIAVYHALHGDVSNVMWNRIMQNCQRMELRCKIKIAEAWQNEERKEPKEIAKVLGNGIKAHESAITAIYIAQRFLNRKFLEMLGYIQAMGGDVDTIGAMAGAIWGAFNGVEKLDSTSIEGRSRIMQLTAEMHSASTQVGVVYSSAT